MNYTNNYHLPQWVETDRIQMEDFNQMCEDIDGGITAAKAAASTAQTTANAAYSPSNKPYVVGTYIGNGGDVTVTLGFKPSFLIISGETSNNANSVSYLGMYTAITCGNSQSSAITLTDTGFTAKVLANNYVPHMSASGRKYDYIAFR